MARRPAPEEERGVRALPHSLDAEQALLGALMIHNDCYRRVQGLLTPEHFYEPLHQRIYNIIAKLLDSGRFASPITLRTFLGNGKIDGGDMTLGEYVARIAADAGQPVDAQNYAQHIRDLYARRNIIALAEKAKEMAYDAQPDAPIGEQLDAFEAEVAALRPITSATSDFKDAYEGADAFMEDVAAAISGHAAHVGMSTGFANLDDALGGLSPTDLIVIAARPGLGKTALAAGIAWKAAEKGHRVAISSMEMSSKQLAGRIIAEMALISAWRVRKRAIDDLDFSDLETARRRYRQLPIFVDETPAITISQLFARARALKKKRGLDLLVVDYIQLMRAFHGRERIVNRVQELSEITGGLKQIAKELQIPVLALSQLSRDVEKRDDKRPQLSDLRESGSIEQDADVVLMIHREEYYLEKSAPREGTEQHDEWKRELERVKGHAEIGIAKQRHGPPGRVKLGWDGAHTRFLNDPPQVQHDGTLASPVQKREVRLTDNAKTLHAILDSMQHLSGVKKPAHVSVQAAGDILIPGLAVRERFAKETTVPGGKAGLVGKPFDDAMRLLKRASIASWVSDGDPSDPKNGYVYLMK